MLLAFLATVPTSGYARPTPASGDSPAHTLLTHPLDRVPMAQLPHPAVARVIAEERGAESHGSGTLIDVRDDCGLVVTNWHVIRDATGTITVRFPNGFVSPARVRKVDKDWDLAALVIWRPPIEPVAISKQAPRRGDLLTIAGYGPGPYRAATGRCIQYVAPGMKFPPEMVELSAEARQGDSGGPIFNDRGELAGVLFGAARGTTTGSYSGRVRAFLTSIAPAPGTLPNAAALAHQPANGTAAGPLESPVTGFPGSSYPTSPHTPPPAAAIPDPAAHVLAPPPPVSSSNSSADTTAFANEPLAPVASPPPAAAGSSDAETWTSTPFPARSPTASAAPPTNSPTNSPTLEQWLAFEGTPLEKAKTVLALIGLLSVIVQLGRLLGANGGRTASSG